jgi:hypothetical protein
VFPVVTSRGEHEDETGPVSARTGDAALSKGARCSVSVLVPNLEELYFSPGRPASERVFALVIVAGIATVTADCLSFTTSCHPGQAALARRCGMLSMSRNERYCDGLLNLRTAMDAGGDDKLIQKDQGFGKLSPCPVVSQPRGAVQITVRVSDLCPIYVIASAGTPDRRNGYPDNRRKPDRYR